MRLSDDELRAALRAEADAHRPDREAMLDRITMAATGEPVTRRRAPQRGSRIRTAAAAAAVAALFAGGGVANWALAGDDDTPPPTPSVTTPPAIPSAAPSSAAPSPASPKSPSRKPAPRTTAPEEPRTKAPEEDPTPLRADGSVVDGSSVVTLTTTEELTALDVVIRVARTEGFAPRGATKRTPGGSVTTSVTEQGDVFLYRFVLSSADTLAPGEYTFTAKYTHPGEGRDAGADTYEATASTASSPDLSVRGDFS
ncbi:hypothetical protein [Actinoplanes sp. NPDC023714]|uniref:hypothetical protein n=1 Tax=Actinoplanes sp. NPDC023714 TaxID=3154322 RepID=UPI0034018D5F